MMFLRKFHSRKKISQLTLLTSIVALLWAVTLPTTASAYDEGTDHLIVGSLLGLAIGAAITSDRHVEHRTTYVTPNRTHYTYRDRPHRVIHPPRRSHYPVDNRQHFYQDRERRRYLRAERRAERQAARDFRRSQRQRHRDAQRSRHHNNHYVTNNQGYHDRRIIEQRGPRLNLNH